MHEMAAEADKMRKLDFEEIQIPPGPRLGNVVVEVDHLSKGFGDRLLIDDLSFTLPRRKFLQFRQLLLCRYLVLRF